MSQHKKRARSEVDAIVVSDMDVEPLTPPSSSPQSPTTGHQAIPPTKRRNKHAKTPSRQQNMQATHSHSCDASGTESASNQVRIFPLRAILDDRVKRRIRRNGLSEEMNIIYGERKQRAKKSVDEMSRLRDQLAAREAENELLREQSSFLQDTSRIQELEREISELKQGMHNSHEAHLHDDWDMAAGDGFSDSGSVLEGDDDRFFRDDTTVEVEDVSRPTSAKLYADARLTTLTPPRTSPTKPRTPESTQLFFRTTGADAGVQAAALADKGTSLLAAELTALQRELVRTREALEAQGQLERDLRAKLLSAEEKAHAAARKVDPDDQLQRDIMLQTLADKTATIAALNASLSSLGAPGLEASHIVTTLKEAFHSARQELEDMGAGEDMGGQPLPTTTWEGTQILGHLRQRLRDSAAQRKQHEGALEAYRLREAQLRRQLNDREEEEAAEAEARMGAMGSELRQKDELICRLAADKARSDAAVARYRDALAEARRSLVEQDAELVSMGANLESMISAAADLQAQLAQGQVDGEVHRAAIEARHHEQTSQRDAQIVELHGDIARLKEALAQAHDSVSQLQDDKTRLQGDADRVKTAARDTVAALRAQLQQSLQMSEAFLAQDSRV